MWRWLGCIVFGLCILACGYMAYLAYWVDDSGWYFFAAFGLFFTIPFAALIRSKKQGKKSREPEPTVFVSHVATMRILLFFCIGMLAAILLPMLLRGN